VSEIFLLTTHVARPLNLPAHKKLLGEKKRDVNEESLESSLANISMKRIYSKGPPVGSTDLSIEIVLTHRYPTRRKDYLGGHVQRCHLLEAAECGILFTFTVAQTNKHLIGTGRSIHQ
jgi:hypothetical protein